jgi:hypothetical protein
MLESFTCLGRKKGDQSQEFTIDRLSITLSFSECFDFAFLGSDIVTPESRRLGGRQSFLAAMANMLTWRIKPCIAICFA